MAEFAAGYNGTNRYHPDRRYDWFPAFRSRLEHCEENFMQSASWIDMLKLRASYGKVGNSFNSNRTFGNGESYLHLQPVLCNRLRLQLRHHALRAYRRKGKAR